MTTGRGIDTVYYLNLRIIFVKQIFSSPEKVKSTMYLSGNFSFFDKVCMFVEGGGGGSLPELSYFNFKRRSVHTHQLEDI